MEQSRRIEPDRLREALDAAVSSEDGTAPEAKVVVLQSPPTAAKWSSLLERVRGAAHYIRAVEDRAQDYELRVQDLVDQVRADLREADAKVRAAEQRTDEVQAQATTLIRAAEERARAAEERAASAEEWLRRIAETIESEFVVEPISRRNGATGT
ncbi:hypothetical protein SAMN05216360_104223 [Methylobacterium phyllostachyos]|uniref:Uncharacterized protein n=1 Tax=Methylobacterium phyllostachyos TaxID=582672 RepID=A0A1G9X2E6_9HYPH|nr:hypothetical protein [Methylobacterium phyllostachyos]SDM90934.1 hypothetical protein SAMN05216360_104223 [Methylobacterium phyllostachyos]